MRHCGTMSNVAPNLPTDAPHSSPTPRRITTPRWLDVRLVVGVALVLVSVAIGARVVSGAGRTRGVVAANRGLAAGKVLTAADLHLAQVRLPADDKGVYLASIDDAVGKQLRRDVSSGELIAAQAVATSSPRTTLTVALASGAAPDLATGQRVEIWMSTPSCPSTVLLPEVTVQQVHKDSSGGFGPADDGQNVVISVPRTLADRVTAALVIDQVQLRAGILRGSPSDGVIRAGTQTLPDISDCLAAPSN